MKEGMNEPGTPKKPDPLLYTGGQLNALIALISALIRTHPEPEKLRATFQRMSALQEAAALNAAVAEDYIKGQRETLSALDQLLEVVAAERKKGSGSN